MFRPDLERYLPADRVQFADAELLEILQDFAVGFVDELEASTLENLAATMQSRWFDVIRDGLVSEVPNADEAQNLLL